MPNLPIICIDFDGVIHSYTSGWQGPDVIPDPPVPGAIAWLMDLLLSSKFTVCIYSSRSRYEEGVRAMQDWLRHYGVSTLAIYSLEFPTQKPAAFLTIDDRAMCFQGVFPSIPDMLAFRPWNKP